MDKNNFSTRLGRNLKAIREKRGLTAEQVAERIGITADSVYKYERGERRLSVEVMMQGVAALEDSVMNVLRGLDPRGYHDDGKAYNILSPSESKIMRYLATDWKGDIHALVIADGLYAALPEEYRREVIMAMVMQADRAVADGKLKQDQLPEGMEYMLQQLGKLYDVRR